MTYTVPQIFGFIYTPFIVRFQIDRLHSQQLREGERATGSSEIRVNILSVGRASYQITGTD